MNCIIKFILFTTIAVVPSAVLAAPQSSETITIASNQTPVFRGGKLQGCALNFEAGRHDPEYNEGEMVYISGSINYYTFENQLPFYALKLGIKKEASGKFVAPFEAYLISGYSTNKEDFVDRMVGDNPGFSLFRFKSGEITTDATLRDISESGKLRFGYALSKGGVAAIVSIDLTMKELNFESPADSTRDMTTPYRWINCHAEALDAAYGPFDDDDAKAAADAAEEAAKAAAGAR